MHKIVISTIEVKQALKKLGKRNATGRYRRKLLHDLREVKKFSQVLSGKSIVDAYNNVDAT